MNGTFIPNTPIAVDFWKLRDCPQARIFFLTHLHGDHITGLTPSWNQPIYCSEITAKLLSHHHQIKKKLIHPLSLDTPHIIYLDQEHREQMTVTVIDANHCPGAVMFLFEGYFGTILHTGDFRFHLPMIEDPPLNKYEGKIDVLYLDNTYCSPACRFASRDEAATEIIDIIKAHPEHDVVIGLRSLGKETLLSKIAISCQEWISVPAKFYETLQLLNAPDVFQNNASDCRIRVEPFHKISNKFIDELNQKTRTIAILPTAIYCGIDARPFDNNDNVFVIPYSDHSSYIELMQFVSLLKPCKILPVVSGSTRGPFGTSVADRGDMSRFDKYLNVSTTTAGKQIPDTVRRLMKGRVSLSFENKKQGVKRKAKKQLSSGAKKFRKKGVEYDDSPIKHVQQQSFPLSTKDRIHDKELLKTNQQDIYVLGNKSLNDSQKGKSQDTTSIQNCIDNSDDNSKDQLHDNGELNTNKVYTVLDDNEIGASQGFIVTGGYNSDDEETVVSLGFEVDIDECRGASRSCCEKETYDCINADNFCTFDGAGQNDLILDNRKTTTESREDEIARNSLTCNSKLQISHKRKVKKALEFKSTWVSEGAQQNKRCQKSVEESSSELKSLGRDGFVHSGICSGNGGNLDEGTENAHDKDLVNTDNSESESILNNITDNHLNCESSDFITRKSIQAVLLEAGKENDHSKPDCEMLDGKVKHTDKSIKVNFKDAINSVDIGNSKTSYSSVIAITSESENKAQSKLIIDEVRRHRITAIDQLSNNTEASNLGSQVLTNSENYEQESANKIKDNFQVKNQSVPDSVLRVIKWQPNIRNIRKQQFHKTLSQFLDG